MQADHRKQCASPKLEVEKSQRKVFAEFVGFCHKQPCIFLLGTSGAICTAVYPRFGLCGRARLWKAWPAGRPYGAESWHRGTSGELRLQGEQASQGWNIGFIEVSLTQQCWLEHNVKRCVSHVKTPLRSKS